MIVESRTGPTTDNWRTFARNIDPDSEQGMETLGRCEGQNKRLGWIKYRFTDAPVAVAA